MLAKVPFAVMSRSSQPDVFKRRMLWLALSFLLLMALFYPSKYYHRKSPPQPTTTALPDSRHPHEKEREWTFVLGRDDLNFGLSDEQCDVAFPDLYQEIYRARDHLVKNNRTIKEQDVHVDREGEYEGHTHGEFQVMIHNGELYVVKEVHGEPDRSRGLAALASMYRAISSVPDPRRQIPNIEFTFDIEDVAQGGEKNPERIRWTWARHKDNPWHWTMPDFDGWSYPDDGVASFVQFREDVAELESNYSRGWYDKTQQLAWRGSFAQNGELRRQLAEAAQGKPWNDVRPIDWHDRKDVLQMQDFCRYQYVAHTEGNSWSGRLRYLHVCDSVPVVHALDWVAHYYPLLQASGARQNYVEVKRDWSDLGDQMDALLADPARARAIARESTRVFRDRYLTPAAEACYWRRLFRTWRSVMDFEPRAHYVSADGKRHRRGVSWERFAFRQEKSFEHGFFEEDKIKDEEDEQ